MPGFGPAAARASQQVALHKIDAHGSKGLEFLARFDTLGEGRRTALAGESYEATNYGQLVGIAVHLVDEAAIDLDELGTELQDV